jgi:hypothetical protein
MVLDMETLVALQARQLERRPEDLEHMKERIWRLRREIGGRYADKYQHTIREVDFEPGRLVLVRNSSLDKGLKNKYKPRYLGPFVVIRKNQGGAYKLAEMDGAVSKLRFSAERLMPYFLRSRVELPKANSKIRYANREEEEDGAPDLEDRTLSHQK